MTRGLTPSQTVGPFFHIGLRRLFRDDLVPPDRAREAIVISGRVVDGDGEPVPDAVLELWQADDRGAYANVDDPGTGFFGWGRVATDPLGNFRLRTLKPGRVVATGGLSHAPHVNVTLFSRGLLGHLFTRIYFAGDPGNAADPVLLAVPESRRHTLIAQRDVGDQSRYSWNIVMQGPRETVFFDW